MMDIAVVTIISIKISGLRRAQRDTYATSEIWRKILLRGESKVVAVSLGIC